MLIQEVEQAVAHLPSSQTTAELILRNKHNAAVVLALRLPLCMDKTKIALRVAIVADGDDSAVMRAASLAWARVRRIAPGFAADQPQSLHGG